jgi:hypothetical protein
MGVWGTSANSFSQTAILRPLPLRSEFIALSMFGPIRSFCLAAGLFLPLSLFVWFWFASTVVLPVLFMFKGILLSWMPEMFADVERNKYMFVVLSKFVTDPAALAQAKEGQILVTESIVNPMIYGYGWPVIAGLALATPISVVKRLWQIALGGVLTWFIQTNGVLWDTLLQINQKMDGGREALALHHLHPEFLGGMYQLGYLILPPLSAVIFWALMNRKFIEDLIKLDQIQGLSDEQATDDLKG